MGWHDWKNIFKTVYFLFDINWCGHFKRPSLLTFNLLEKYIICGHKANARRILLLRRKNNIYNVACELFYKHYSMGTLLNYCGNIQLQIRKYKKKTRNWKLRNTMTGCIRYVGVKAPSLFIENVIRRVVRIFITRRLGSIIMITR